MPVNYCFNFSNKGASGFISNQNAFHLGVERFRISAMLACL